MSCSQESPSILGRKREATLKLPEEAFRRYRPATASVKECGPAGSDTHDGKEPANLFVDPCVVSIIGVAKMGADLATRFIGKQNEEVRKAVGLRGHEELVLSHATHYICSFEAARTPLESCRSETGVYPIGGGEGVRAYETQLSCRTQLLYHFPRIYICQVYDVDLRA